MADSGLETADWVTPMPSPGQAYEHSLGGFCCVALGSVCALLLICLGTLEQVPSPLKDVALPPVNGG